MGSGFKSVEPLILIAILGLLFGLALPLARQFGFSNWAAFAVSLVGFVILMLALNSLNLFERFKESKSRLDDDQEPS
ncbi:hypothetical protein HG15A2_00350 [Adhaeretor mobilis]|uniref:Uncharacterized protein n=1 Tax=Adhaeretor mobilis TaxID=1930276 RepID=A0A517MPR3_9BACT|nr:hypothetical protein HG15A2_00350 [Adhaeretor mobilis]